MNDITRPSYADQCAAAATAQGLDPVVAALTARGWHATVEQTGGFTMVAVLRCRRGVVAITDDGGYMVGAYPGTSWDDGESDEALHDFGLTLDGMIDVVFDRAVIFGGAL